MAVLEDYQKASGQRINRRKSSFLCSNKIMSSRIRSISNLLGINRAGGFFCYLGVPLAVGRLKVRDFQPVIDKVEGADGKRKLHWRSWEAITRPKTEGGLGIRKLSEVMHAFQIKMAWTLKFQKDSSFWAVFMAAKYGTMQDSTSTINDRVGSPTWKKMRNLMPFLNEKVQWSIGEGECRCWQENWTSLGPLQNYVSGDILEEIKDLKVKQILGPAGPLPPTVVLSMLPQ
ncbi:uncharacterized protein LOC131225143 [Magnolia sinica]|uniref:uncharacterized protein LOC131225143 n=1 Tax=Magnolia sinica TaxID=86752 RepID=UPI002658C4FD|nr:uncharacterized protein LOC131225143 [Magnolia sinica]